MVVSAHVEDGVVFAIVPSDVFFLGIDEREESFILSFHGFALFDLCEEPAS